MFDINDFYVQHTLYLFAVFQTRAGGNLKGYLFLKLFCKRRVPSAYWAMRRVLSVLGTGLRRDFHEVLVTFRMHVS